MTSNTATAQSATRETTATPRHTVAESASIAAPPERVYSIIANYREGHPHILPPIFTGLDVEQGGIGAGTIITFGMRIFGRTHTFRAAVTEPEPGRVLVESNFGAYGAVSTFIVDPGPQPGHSQVTISTELKVRKGLLGKIEAYLSAKLLHPTYIQELELLAKRATDGSFLVDSRR